MHPALLALLAACSGGDDTGDDTPSDPLDHLAPPDWYGAPSFTVEPDRGLAWERDPDFEIEMFAVPQIFVRPDGTYVMLATNMTDPYGRWYLTSEDGLAWTAADEALFLPEDFPVDCGNRLEDGLLIPTRDDGFRLLMEGTYLPEPGANTDWRVWCQASSDDAVSFTPLDEYIYTGSEVDADVPSVPSLLLLDDWSALIFYVGDLYREVSPDGNSIRIARVDARTHLASPYVEANVLPSDNVDPHPVWLEGGGIRLYHTNHIQGEGPGPGYADATDGLAFGDPVRLLSPEGHCAFAGGECLLDPTFLHLPDDRLVLYFTRLGTDEKGEGHPSIRRAFATD